MEPLLVGVVHSTYRDRLQQDFLNAECKRNFTSEIVPRLANDSLLVIEGRFTEKIYRFGMFWYNWRLRQAERALVPLHARPALTWRDPRARLFNVYSCVEDLGCLVAGMPLLSRITFPTLPPTFRELASVVRENKLVYEMPKFVLTQEIMRAAFAFARSLAAFDRCMIEAVRSWKEDGRVFVVTGAMHTLSLHKRTGWPVCFLGDYGEHRRLLAENAVFGLALAETAQ